MNITDRDYREIGLVGELLILVNKLGQKEAEEISERMVANQPFIMSLLLGYRVDVAENEFDDVFKVVIVIYLYFENDFDILRHQISANDFEETHSRNMEFLKYFEGEEGSESRLELQGMNLSNLRSKGLLTGVLKMINEQGGFKKMDQGLKGIIFVGMKALIECLEVKLGTEKHSTQ